MLGLLGSFFLQFGLTLLLNGCGLALLLLGGGADRVVDKVVLERFYTKAGRVAAVITFLPAEGPPVGRNEVGRVLGGATGSG